MERSGFWSGLKSILLCTHNWNTNTEMDCLWCITIWSRSSTWGSDDNYRTWV